MTGGREHICIIRHEYSNFLTLTLKNTLTTFLNVFVPAGRIPRTPPLLKKSTDAAARFFTSLRFTSPQGLLHFLSLLLSFFPSQLLQPLHPQSSSHSPSTHTSPPRKSISPPTRAHFPAHLHTYIQTNEVLYTSISD